MKFTRGKRIALELLGPPFVGTLIALALGSAKAIRESVLSGQWTGWDFRIIQGFVLGFIFSLPFAYIFAGVQSIVYTLIMEWRFALGLDPRNWRSVGLSTALGFASGAVICMGFGPAYSDTRALWLYFGGIGLAVGFVLGLLIKSWSVQPAASS